MWNTGSLRRCESPVVSSRSCGRRNWLLATGNWKLNMAKEVLVKIKLQAPGGTATPAPPIGPALGQHGVNIGQFVQQFNAQTKELNSMIVPVEITVYKDKTFTFLVKSPPAAILLKEAAGIAKGSGVPNKEKVGKVTWAQVRKISE